MDTAKKNEEKTMAKTLEWMAKETEDPVAKDLFSIRWHSQSIFDGICLILEVLEPHQKQGINFGRSEELLNELIGEIAHGFRESDRGKVINSCESYSAMLRKLLQKKKAE